MAPNVRVVKPKGWALVRQHFLKRTLATKGIKKVRKTTEKPQADAKKAPMKAMAKAKAKAKAKAEKPKGWALVRQHFFKKTLAKKGIKGVRKTIAKKTPTPMRAMAKAKGRGFPKYVCPLAKTDFLKHAVAQTFEIEAIPTVFGPGGFGWKWNKIPKIEADGPDSTALGDAVVTALAGCNFVVLGAKQGTCGISKTKFMKNATPLKVTLTAEAYEFSSGSFGWQTNGKKDVEVAGVPLKLQYNLNVVCKGTKPEGDHTEDKDSELAKISKDAVAKHLPKIGKASAAQKDDLTKIKGIGPFIAKRLNHIQIYTYSQLSKMTPDIEKDVVKAIMYFPGRQRRDKWVEQAAAMAK